MAMAKKISKAPPTKEVPAKKNQPTSVRSLVKTIGLKSPAHISNQTPRAAKLAAQSIPTPPLTSRTANTTNSITAKTQSWLCHIWRRVWPTRHPHQAQLDEVKASVLAELSQRGQSQNLKISPFAATSNPLNSIVLPSNRGAAYRPTPWWVWTSAATAILGGVWVLLLQTPTSEKGPMANNFATTASQSASQNLTPSLPALADTPQAAATSLSSSPLQLAQVQRALGSDGRLRWTLTFKNSGKNSLPANTLSSFVVADAVGQPLASTMVPIPQALQPGQMATQTVLMTLKNTPVHRAVLQEPLEAFQLALHSCC